MAEILSQEEIDELLSALSTGEVAVEKAQHESRQRRVKKYDFRRPDKFSKEQLRTIQMVHDTFARLLSSSLSAFLRTIVEAEVVGWISLPTMNSSVPFPTPVPRLSATSSPLRKRDHQFGHAAELLHYRQAPGGRGQARCGS